MSLTATLQYLYRLERFGIRLGLETMTALVAALGNPQQQFRSVHITGTNGKGSTAALLEAALRAGGVRTGLYTSPHLYRFHERMKVRGQEPTDHEVHQLVEDVREAAARAGIQPTFFEFTTAMAFLHFARCAVELAVVEVGMGGDLDATNVITPLVSVITNVELDHTDVLGQTRREIAARKAGIIKAGVPVVTAEQDADTRAYLAEVAAARQASLVHVQQHLQAELLAEDWHHQTFRTQGVSTSTFTMPLIGSHQLDNARTALVVLSLLGARGVPVTLAAIQHGFAATQWEGRLEVVSERPFVLIDGAHNERGFQVLAEMVGRMPRRDVVVLGLKKDKLSATLLERIVPVFGRVIVTEGSYQPLPAAELARRVHAVGTPVEIVRDPVAATQRGLDIVGTEGGLLVTGSLYVIPHALALLKHRTPVGPLIP